MKYISALLLFLPLCAFAHSDATLYGQVNKGLFGYHDGASREVVVADNNFSSTRFGLKGKRNLNHGLAAAFLLEGEAVDNGSHALTQRVAGALPATPANSANALLTSRHANVGLVGPLGGVYIGKLSTAVDGVLTQDLAGASDIMSAEYRRVGGGLRFHKQTGGFGTYNINALTEAQANSRSNGVRYDSPVVEGFQLKAAGAQGGDLDLAAYYAGQVFGMEAKGGAGMHFNNDGTIGANMVDRRFLSSASLRHPLGLAATVAYSQGSLENRTPGAQDPQSLYAKVGYVKDTYDVAADWGRSNHMNNAVLADNRLDTYGLAGQYALADGVSVGVLYRIFSAEVSGDVNDDIHVYGTTLRVKF